jgi:hypothetical protein
MKEPITLGARVVDTISGFTGTVVATAVYLDNPVLRILVQPPHVGEFGQFVDPTWIDETRLTVDAGGF